jgi:hypothetical protein
MMEGSYTEKVQDKRKIVKTDNMYIDVSVYTQAKEDCPQGIFDFENMYIDPETCHIGDESDDGSRRNRNNNCEVCKFQARGTSYITRQSKY